MKVRIKSFNGELPKYLTLGKVYETSNTRKIGDDIYFSIHCDDGVLINSRLRDCILWLNGGSWDVINDH